MQYSCSGHNFANGQVSSVLVDNVEKKLINLIYLNLIRHHLSPQILLMECISQVIAYFSTYFHQAQ